MNFPYGVIQTVVAQVHLRTRTIRPTGRRRRRPCDATATRAVPGEVDFDPSELRFAGRASRRQIRHRHSLGLYAVPGAP